MFGTDPRSLVAIPSVVNLPKWVSCDGIDLANRDFFAALGSDNR